jgi:hypothetical protein
MSLERASGCGALLDATSPRAALGVRPSGLVAGACPIAAHVAADRVSTALRAIVTDSRVLILMTVSAGKS